VSGAVGNDANVGCTPDKPLKTIGGAIGRARTLGVRDHEAIVCGGVYSEPQFVLDHPLSIRGGFDCLTFTRPEGFGWPKLALTPETRVEKATPSGATLVVEGDIPASVELDGLTITGPTTGEGGIGVLVKKGAAPTIHDCLIGGGATTNVGFFPGATGLAIEDASPSVSRSEIRGGAGTAPAFGSLGITVVNGAPSLRDIRVDAGQSSSGTVGVFISGKVTMRGDRALRADISWTAAATTARGIYLSGAGVDVEVDGSILRGGPVACTGDASACSSAGIIVDHQAKLTVHHSRIIGGEVTSPGTGSSSSAIATSNASSVDIANSFLHSGNVGARTLVASAGVHLVATPNAQLHHNTIFTSGGSANALAAGIRLQGATTKDAAIVNNLIGSNKGAGVGVSLDFCANATIATLKGNAFVSTTPAFRRYTSCSAAVFQDFPSMASVEAALPGAASANIRVVGSGATACAGDSAAQCLQLPECALLDTCPPAVIEGWDTATAGRSTLFGAGGGWKLTSPGACRLGEGGIALDRPLTTDAFGVARTTPPSIGAHELELCSGD
jgi:hypothetical protein